MANTQHNGFHDSQNGHVDFEQWFRQAHPRRHVHYDLVFVSLKNFLLCSISGDFPHRKMLKKWQSSLQRF